MTRHQYGISVLASRQTSFRGVSSGGVAKCRLLSQADSTIDVIWIHTHLWVISIVLWKTATLSYCLISSLRKQPTFGDATTGFPAKWRLRNERRNSILMTRHYPDNGSVSGWSCRVGNLIQPIRSTTHISVGTRHQYRISAFVSQTSFGGETSGSVTKCRLVS